MLTAAKLAANRANAMKSTGPRTAEGKARAAQNARRHGLRAVFLADEGYTQEIKDFEQPATWVTLQTGDMGNTFLVSFRSVSAVVVAGPVGPVGNAVALPTSPQVCCLGLRRRSPR